MIIKSIPGSIGVVLVSLIAMPLQQGCLTADMQKEQHWKAYRTAMMHGDVASAITEVNAVYALDTNAQSALDTLVRLYYVRGNYISAYKTGSKIIEKEAIHKSILAESALQLGKTDEAKQYMLDVEAADSAELSLNSRYKLATLHYNDNEFQEALILLGKIVDDEMSLEQMTRITGDNSVTQSVSIYAASHNFAGYVFLKIGELGMAESHFNEALRTQPDFQLAKNNMAELEVRKMQPSTGE